LKYAIIPPYLRPHAEKFGVRQDPDIKDCVQRLLKSPPKTKAEAEEKFAYMAGRSNDLNKMQSLINDISVSKLVPILRKYYLDGSGFEDSSKQQTGKSETRIHHYDPPETVFVGRDQEYKNILDYVNYSPEATAFLLQVGAKHEPTSHDLAYLVCRNPSRFLNTIGQEKYLDLLRKLAGNAAHWKDKDLASTMKTSKILLGYREIRDESKKLIPVEDDNLDDFDEVDVRRECLLARANDLVIIDDVGISAMFREFIISAPQEEVLEEFYARFGVKRISELIQTETRIGAIAREQAPAQTLRKNILERARLFLHDYEQDTSQKHILHDAKWLNNNLSVQCVSDISLRYRLADRDVAKSITKTAVAQKYRGSGLVLSITPKYDMFEVSSELVPMLIRRPKKHDTIALERFLTESLRRLQAKGINVERILRKKEYEARVFKQQEVERELEEQQRMAEQAKSGAVAPKDEKSQAVVPRTPDKSHEMPGAFGTPENDADVDNNRAPVDKGVISNWAKKLGFKNDNPTPRTGTDSSQINRDISSTKSNIANAIKECRPTNMEAINTKHHQDPTELDKGGYCNGEQWENLHKAFTIPYANRTVDVYYGKNQSESPASLQGSLSSFLPLIFGLTSIFGVNPAAVNIFLDSKSNTVAFNLSGSLFFNLAWYMALHETNFQTVEGRLRAADSWFFTYAHELAHNLVSDHNARHSWYQQQIAIEYSQQYRAALGGFLQGTIADVE
jgi:hypothetical protein